MEINVTPEEGQVLALLATRSFPPTTPEQIVAGVVERYIKGKKAAMDAEFASGPSEIERMFQIERDAAKVAAIQHIKSNPECTEEDILVLVTPMCTIINPAALMPVYVGGAFEKGMISENTFAAFKEFVLARTPEELMQI
jgi:hypothetical protein